MPESRGEIIDFPHQPQPQGPYPMRNQLPLAPRRHLQVVPDQAEVHHDQRNLIIAAAATAVIVSAGVAIHYFRSEHGGQA